MNVADFQVRHPGTGVRSAGLPSSPVQSALGGFPTNRESPWTLPIEHLSATSLQMLQICPRQWQERYLHNKKEIPGQALVVGQVNHKAHGFNWNVKAVSGSDVPTSTIIDYYHDDVWPKVVEEYGGQNEIQWDSENLDEVRLHGAKMITTYHEQVSPRLTPVEVEKEFSMTLEGLPVPVVGYIDLTQGRDRPIVDLKTSSKKMSKMKAGWRLQGLVYQLAESRPVDWHVITKAKEPVALTPLEEPALAQPINVFQLANATALVKNLAWTANHYYTTIGPDDPWPTVGLGHDWRCDWCGYRKNCPAWRVA